MIRKTISLLLILLLVGSSISTCFAVSGISNFRPSRSYPEGKFSDVRDSDWFSGSVKKAYSYGLINGNSDTTYNPNGDVTVAETLSIACKLNSIFYGRSVEPASGQWYQCYVDYALANGIITKGQFPSYTAKATRREFAAILAHSLPDDAYEAINVIEENAIPDVKSGDKYADEIYMLYRAGIMAGNDDEGTYTPNSNIMRSAVATIVSNIVDPSSRRHRNLKNDSIGMTFEELLAGLNAKREKNTKVVRTAREIAPYTPDFSDTLDLVSEAEAKSLNTRRNSIETVSKDGAKADVDLLFRLYKAYYASYEFFGGDSAFNAAKTKILAAVDGQKGDTVNTDWLARTVCTNLSFVQDGHASIGDCLFCDANNIRPHDYYVKGLFFYKDENGYFTRLGGKKAYLRSVGSASGVDEYLRISIDDIGRLCYILSVSEVSGGPELNISSIVLDISGKKQTQNISWTQFSTRKVTSKTFSQKIALHDSIPYVCIFDGESGDRDDELETIFTDMNSYLKDQDAAVFNIVTGGAGYIAVAGKAKIDCDEIKAYKMSNVMKYIGQTNCPPGGVLGKYNVLISDAVWHKNDRIQFVLQDVCNASAHEDFICMLSSYENTVFVGGRTAGLILNGGCHHFWLPESHLQFQCGMFLNLANDGAVNLDGIGYEPDIWIDLPDAADAIYRLCSYYGIKNNASTEAIRKSLYYSDFNSAEPKSSDRISLRISGRNDVVTSDSGFGFGKIQKEVTVMLDGKPVTDFRYEMTGDTVGTVTKTAKGTLVLNAVSNGDADIKITVGDLSAVFSWHVRQ